MATALVEKESEVCIVGKASRHQGISDHVESLGHVDAPLTKVLDLKLFAVSAELGRLDIAFLLEHFFVFDIMLHFFQLLLSADDVLHLVDPLQELLVEDGADFGLIHDKMRVGAARLSREDVRQAGLNVSFGGDDFWSLAQADLRGTFELLFTDFDAPLSDLGFCLVRHSHLFLVTLGISLLVFAIE